MELVSQREYARRRGVAASLVNKYVKQGKIQLTGGKVNPAQADQIFDAGGEKGPSYWEEKARHEKIKADLAEIELARRRKELVEVDAVDQEISKMCYAVRQKLLSVPSKIAQITHNQKTIAATQRLIEQGIHGAMEELGNYDPKSGKIVCPRTVKRKKIK